MGQEVNYERRSLAFTQPAVERSYTPDFILDNGIVIETKGLFTVEDRKKHLYIQQDHPYLDLRFVFQNANNKITKRSKTSYAAWCEKYGFRWANKLIPAEWFDEPPNRANVITLERILKWKPLKGRET